MAIDLAEDPQSLASLLGRLQRPPSDHGDDGPGGDDGGGGDPHGPGRVRRSGNDRRRANRERSDGGLGVHEAVRRAANRANDIEDADMEGGPHDGLGVLAASPLDDYLEPEDPLDLDDDDVIVTSETLHLPGELEVKQEKDEDELVMAEVTFHRRGATSTGWTPTTFPCGIPWCGGRGCRHMQMRPNWEAVEAICDSPMESKEMSENPVVNNDDTELDEPNQSHEPEHTRGPGNSDDPSGHHGPDFGRGSVCMLSTVYGAEALESTHGQPHGVGMDATLKHLAQRLQRLKEKTDGPIPHCRSGHRPSTDWMAMSRQSLQRQGEIRPVCEVDVMPQVRIAADLRDQGERAWRDPITGSCAGTGGDGPRGAAIGVPSQRDERKDLSGQGDGDQRATTGDDPWARECQNRHPCGRAPGRSSSGSDGDGGDNAGEKIYHEEHYNADCQKEPDNTCAGDPKSDKECLPITKPGKIYDVSCCGQGQGQVNVSAQTRGSRASDAPLDTGDDRDGGDLQRRERRDHRGRLDGLWAALGALRERMSSGKGAGWNGSAKSDCGPRLEADCHKTKSSTFNESSNDGNNQPTCTTSTTPSDTTNDILSVKNCFTREILPPLAKKLAQAATLTAIVLAPLTEVLKATEAQLDLLEVACSPTSTLTATFEKNGFLCERANYLTGYDLDSRKGTSALAETIKNKKPRFTWVSLPCTRLSSLQNLTERDEEAWSRFLKRRGQDLRRADEVAQSLEPVLEADDFGWEWPIGAVTGWRSHAIQRLERMAKRHGRVLHRVKIHGCQYGLTWKGFPLKKGWMILTTSRELFLKVNKRCPGDHAHMECRGDAAKASSYYPEKLCQSILNAIQHQWKNQDRQVIYLAEKHLLNVEPELMVDLETDFPVEKVMALLRTRLDLSEAPKGKKLESIKQLMMRVHRAAGHPGFSKLQDLLRARGSPAWAVELAGTLECPECKEAAKPRLVPPASMFWEATFSSWKTVRSNTLASFGGIAQVVW